MERGGGRERGALAQRGSRPTRPSNTRDAAEMDMTALTWAGEPRSGFKSRF